MFVLQIHIYSLKCIVRKVWKEKECTSYSGLYMPYLLAITSFFFISRCFVSYLIFLFGTNNYVIQYKWASHPIIKVLITRWLFIISQEKSYGFSWHCDISRFGTLKNPSLLQPYIAGRYNCAIVLLSLSLHIFFNLHQWGTMNKFIDVNCYLLKRECNIQIM
jgi:hypothetical protein